MLKKLSNWIFPICFIAWYGNILHSQELSREDFRLQVQQAIEINDLIHTDSLIQAYRGETISFIESLLDSVIIKTATLNIDGAEEDWQLADQLAKHYHTLFDDGYYQQRARRYRNWQKYHIDQKAEIIQLKTEARQDFYQGEFQAALQKYETAWEIAISIDDVDDNATLPGSIGATYFYLGEFDTALAYYQKSLTLLEKIGDYRRIGNQLGNIANVYSDKSDYPNALAYFERAIQIRKELNDRRGLGADLNNVGLVYEEMGEYLKALNHYQQALSINQEIDNQRSVGKNLANIANVHINLGDYPDAIQTYSKALEIRKQVGDRKGEGNDLGNLGLVYQNMGDYNKALEFFQQAIDIHSSIGYREGEAYQLARIASLYGLAGEYARAIQTYQQAYEIHNALGHQRGAANWLIALGEMYSFVGDHSRAMENYQLALNLHEEIRNPSGKAATLCKMGISHLHHQALPEAQDCFEKALLIHEEIGEKWGACIDLGNLSFLHNSLQDSLKTIECWERANNIAAGLGDNYLEAWLQQLKGDFNREHGNTNLALAAYEKGLTLTDGLVMPDLRWQLYFGRGRLREQLGDRESALIDYQAAVRLVEQIRAQSRVDELKAGIIEDRFQVYESIIDLLYNMGNLAEAFTYVERSRSRNLLDLLGNSKLKNRLNHTMELSDKEQLLRTKIDWLNKQLASRADLHRGSKRGPADKIYRSSLNQAQKEYHRIMTDLKLRNPEYTKMVSVEPLKLTEVQQILDPECALLEYFITNSCTYAFILTNNALNALRIPEGENSLRGKILLFRGTAVQTSNKDKEEVAHWELPLKNLYEILITPLEENGYLTGIKHLVIVPHGILHYLPFQTLIKSRNMETAEDEPHYLINDYIISYSPSASVLKYCLRPEKDPRDNLLLLAPRTTSLPVSEKEVVSIAKIFGEKAQYFLQDQATECLMKKESENFGMVHLATSAHFNKMNPLFSYLELKECEQEDGKLEVHEIFNMELSARMITLSACQTGLGSGYTSIIPQGDDLVSLMRAFLYAGSRMVVASLWEINDPSTAEFMKRFYQNLQFSDPAEALALTQRHLISEEFDNGKYSRPYYWAPFVLIGAW